MLLIDPLHQTAEVVAAGLWFLFHNHRPPAALGLLLLAEVRIDQTRKIRLVVEERRLRGRLSSLQVTVFQGVLGVVFTVGELLPSVLILEDPAALPAQPARESHNRSVVTQEQEANSLLIWSLTLYDLGELINDGLTRL